MSPIETKQPRLHDGYDDWMIPSKGRRLSNEQIEELCTFKRARISPDEGEGNQIPQRALATMASGDASVLQASQANGKTSTTTQLSLSTNEESNMSQSGSSQSATNSGGEAGDAETAVKGPSSSTSQAELDRLDTGIKDVAIKILQQTLKHSEEQRNQLLKEQKTTLALLRNTMAQQRASEWKAGEFAVRSDRACFTLRESNRQLEKELQEARNKLKEVRSRLIDSSKSESKGLEEQPDQFLEQQKLKESGEQRNQLLEQQKLKVAEEQRNQLLEDQKTTLEILQNTLVEKQATAFTAGAFTARADEACSENRQLQKELEKTRKELGTVKEELKETRNKMQSTRQYCNRLRADFTRSEKALEKAEKQIQFGRSYRDSLSRHFEKKLEKSRNQLKEVRMNRDQLEKEFEGTRKELREVQMNRDALTKYLEEAERIEQQNEDLLARLKSTSSAPEDGNGISQSQSSQDANEVTIEALQLEIKELKDQLKDARKIRGLEENGWTRIGNRTPKEQLMDARNLSLPDTS
jgi:chromosome segregation ATPase